MADEALFKHGHEEEAHSQKADTAKWDNNWDEINKQREEIKAIKDKQRLSKLEAEEYGTPIIDEETQHKIEESHNKWKDTHEAQAKVIKADTSKWDNDWDKINQQREEIKAIKDKQRIAKLEAEEYGAPIIDDATKEKIEESHNKWKDTHEAQAKVIKAESSKWDNDWKTINKQREEIRAIKEKKRLSKLVTAQGDIDDETREKIEKSHNKWKDTHEKQAKVIKANKKWDKDWDKINAKRAEIKAIKQKKRLSKMQSENELVDRNAKKKQTDKKFKNAHDKKPKKMAAVTSKWDNDWDKINAKRAEIKAIKAKKRLAKLEKENELQLRNKKKKDTDKKFKNAHEVTPKKMAPKERVGTNWSKIEKEREKIKALKEKRRGEKAEKEAAAAQAHVRAVSSAKSKKTPKKKTPKKKKEKKKEDTSSEEEYEEFHQTKFGNMHEKDNKVIKANKNWDNDWEKINAKRAEIRAIKEKKRMSKIEKENELQLRNQNKKETDKKFTNAHDKKPKKMAAKERVGTDWDKIEKQRQEIKALKEKKRQAKLKAQNELKLRNKNKKNTDKKFKNAHDKKPKKMVAKERVGTDWDKIQKQREEIRALKAKRKREKEQGGPKIVRTTTFGNMHEQ